MTRKKKDTKSLHLVSETRRCKGFDRCGNHTINGGGFCAICLKEQADADKVVRRLLSRPPAAL